MDPVVRKNDLIYYQSVTDGGGPAMTWAMHSIGWLEYGAEKNASDMFKKNFNYMRAPFNVSLGVIHPSIPSIRQFSFVVNYLVKNAYV